MHVTLCLTALTFFSKSAIFCFMSLSRSAIFCCMSLSKSVAAICFMGESRMHDINTMHVTLCLTALTFFSKSAIFCFMSLFSLSKSAILCFMSLFFFSKSAIIILTIAFCFCSISENLHNFTVFSKPHLTKNIPAHHQAAGLLAVLEQDVSCLWLQSANAIGRRKNAWQ